MRSSNIFGIPSAFIIRWLIVIAVFVLLFICYFTFYRSGDANKLLYLNDVIFRKDRMEKEEIQNGNGTDGNSVWWKQNIDNIDNGGTVKKEKVKLVESFAESNCPTWNEGMINVHFILHSHDDPGWLKTPQQYYDQDVRRILNSAIMQLVMEPQRKFLYSEMYFFNKWWKILEEPVRTVVTRLVQNGQLEFVGGGWVQNDDASTHYTAAIDQLTYGWSKIDDLFGQRALPQTGWHVDNFGYSQEQAHIFQQMGLDEDVIVRLHHLDIVERRKTKQMEFLWKSSPGNSLFTHILFDHYTSPAGFQYESLYNNYDAVTNQNVEQKTDEILQIIEQRSKSYQTGHLLFIMGNDFVYKEARIWFDSLDGLIRHGNLRQFNGSNISLFYSTPACYFKAVREEASKQKVVWPEYNGDFYPYATSAGSYWTGYFSSRTPLKRNIRVANNVLLTAQNLAGSVSMRQVDQHLNSSKEALYTTLHHDGITGTCKQAVADDYLRLTLSSMRHSQAAMNIILPMLAGRKSKAEFQFCPLANISVCPITQQSDAMSIVVMNGFSLDRSAFVRIPVAEAAAYDLTDLDGESVEYQILPVTDEVKQLGNASIGSSNTELGFFASLPALGFSTFVLKKRSESSGNRRKVLSMGMQDEEINNGDKAMVEIAASIENEFFTLEFNNTGVLSSIVDKRQGNKRMRITQEFFWYSNKDSGAYMLRPEVLNPVTNRSVKLERVLKGSLVQEVRQTFSNWVTQVMRVFKGKPYIEFEWTVGPLEPEGVGKEVITRFSTNMRTDRTFYTDANGRRMMKRKRDRKDALHPLAASYYPITTVAALRDKDMQLSVITDRSLGASSVTDGTLEMIVYRKLIYDDGAGMGEGLDERDQNNRPIVVRGKMWLTVDTISQADANWRLLAKEMFYEPVLAFTQSSLKSWPSKISMLSRPLPAPIHLLTLQRLTEHSCLIRFEYFHSNEFSSKQESTSPVTFEFQDLFRGLDLENCYKTQLGGWTRNVPSESATFTASVLPMDIATYKCQCRSTMNFDQQRPV